MKPPLNATRLRFVVRIVLCACWVHLSTLLPLRAQQFPANFAGTQLVTGIDPVDLAIAPDGRLFLAEKAGLIRIVRGSTVLSTPLLKLSNVDVYNECGMLGITLDPDFATNGYLYVHYTYKYPKTGKSHNRISRFTVSGDRAQTSSERILLELEENLSVRIHNGGGIFFREGKLYILVGDNTAASVYPQNLRISKGKVLRINPDGSIPTDNPYYNATEGHLRAIYAIGLRNPFKGAVQNGTGRMYVGDVGQAGYEEINEVGPGSNFGWPMIEGKRVKQTAPAGYRDPVGGYPHADGCAITAASFYNPTTAQFPKSYVGKFFFGDYCNGWLRTFDPVTKATATFATGLLRPVDIEVGEDGSFYFLSRGSSDDLTLTQGVGSLWKVEYRGNGAPNIGMQPADRTVTVGNPAQFSVSASGTPAPTYQWQRNGVNIAGATAEQYTLPKTTKADDGAKFRVVVTNSVGTITSDAATLTVSANQKPTARILTPVAGTTYAGGTLIQFSGEATDPEEGTLPASAFLWTMDLYHYDPPAHTHPVMAPLSGVRSGSFAVPTMGETSPNVLYRLYLTVTDSAGLTSTTTFDIQPRRADVTLASEPAGIDLKLDGHEETSPYTFRGVTGLERSLEAPASQTLGTSTYQFYGWSDGTNTRERTLATPAASTTYTAQYIRAATNVPNATAGLTYSYYEGGFSQLPQFSTLKTVRSGRVATFSLSPASRQDQFAMRYTGAVRVPTDGLYTFYTSSDDGSRLYIGERLVVDNDGLHAAEERSGSLYLRAGLHPIEVVFFENGGGQVLDVSYAGPGLSKRTIPASALVSEGSPEPVVTEPAPPANGGCTTSAHLSDLTWARASNAWGPVEKNKSNGEQGGGDGRTIQIRGERYAKGLGVHATSEIVYPLDGTWTRFKADLGIDDEVASTDPASVVFEVWADGQRLYQSATLRRNSAIVGINVDVTGKKELRLVVTDGGDGNGYDHADWADARLERTCGTQPAGDTQAPTAPANLTSANVSQTGLTLNWSAATDNVGVTAYEVYRGTVLIGTVSGTSFTVTGLMAGTGYGFTVKAKDAAGNVSPASSTHTVTTQPTPTLPTNPPAAVNPPAGCQEQTSYLSDLSWASATNGWGPVEKDKSNGEQGGGDGNPLRINGKTYAKGLGVHVASEITYNLGGTWSRFKAELGVDDEVPDYAPASVVFEVWADGQRLFRSAILRPTSAPVPFDLDVSGKQQLKLVVADGGDGNGYDHADWADARLVKACISTTPVPAPPQTTPPVTVNATYEAEDARLSGPTVSTQHPGHTGTGFADFLNATGDFIEWTISIPTAGTYTLGFRYALGSDANRPLGVQVNGTVVAASLAFPPTATWTDWQYASVSVNLPAGTSTVRVSSIGVNGPNVDHLHVSSKGSTGRLAAATRESAGLKPYVYPNPAQEHVYLSSPETVRKAELLDGSGRVVTRFQPTAGHPEAERLSLKHVPAGLYLLRVTTPTRTYLLKVVKQ
jgi:glucose/arabinose dehydrogenase/chitodextrinase